MMISTREGRLWAPPATPGRASAAARTTDPISTVSRRPMRFSSLRRDSLLSTGEPYVNRLDGGERIEIPDWEVTDGGRLRRARARDVGSDGPPALLAVHGRAGGSGSVLPVARRPRTGHH